MGHWTLLLGNGHYCWALGTTAGPLGTTTGSLGTTGGPLGTTSGPLGSTGGPLGTTCEPLGTTAGYWVLLVPSGTAVVSSGPLVLPGAQH